jgi:hypothetical protein
MRLTRLACGSAWLLTLADGSSDEASLWNR